jgi:hypothetical protein
MSKNSPRQTYQASQEWLKWAKSKYPILKKKKKTVQQPPFSEY